MIAIFKYQRKVLSKMRVRIIHANDEYELENKINDFLSKTSDDNIIDIKYQGIGNHSAYSTNYPSAMVIMKS